MRRIGALLLLLLTGVTATSGISIETAYTRFYEEGDIKPLAQYFGGDLTNQRFRTVVASQPGTPGGQYFIARLADFKGAGATSARMTLYTTSSKEPETHSWNLEGIRLKGWLYLGLTGADWPDEAIRPLAWRIEILNAEGTVLADWNSFLWELE